MAIDWPGIELCDQGYAQLDHLSEKTLYYMVHGARSLSCMWFGLSKSIARSVAITLARVNGNPGRHGAQAGGWNNKR